jgi:hypothetical protein
MPSAKVAGAAIWLLAILMSPPPSFGQTPVQDVQNALSQVTKAAAEVTSQVQQASQQAQAKVNELPQPSIEPKPQMEAVSEGERTHLCGKITAFTGHAQSEELKYSRLALATIVLAAGLALVGSIASFLAKNKTAGVISLVVAATVGFSNAYPIGPVADFYRSLAGQANALSVECDYTKPYTINAYASNLNQLKLLYVYEDKRPGLGSYRLSTDDLTKQLQVVRTTANNLTNAVTENALDDLTEERSARRVAKAPKKD